MIDLTPCKDCRGLMPGLPPQLYDQTEECTCEKPSLMDWLLKIKNTSCICGTPLLPWNLMHRDSDAGWPVQGFTEKQWLHITCEKCQRENALWKLGAPRPDHPEDGAGS